MSSTRDRSEKCPCTFGNLHGRSEDSLEEEECLDDRGRTRRSRTTPVGPSSCGFVAQIVSASTRPDGSFEARVLLAPEVDMSSIRVTVKSDNLRVTVHRRSSGTNPSFCLGDSSEMTMKHQENFLVPRSVDGDKVRAVVDNKTRLLVLTAPAAKEVLGGAARRSFHDCFR